MIGKEPLLDQYTQTIVQYIDTQKQLITLKNQTLHKFNEVSIVHYEKNQEKIAQIRQEFDLTASYQEKLNVFVKKLDEIGNTIEGMESSVDYIDVIIKRVESKLEELERI